MTAGADEPFGMLPPDAMAEDIVSDAEIIGGTRGSDPDDPPMIVPVRAYYFTRAEDTLRSISAQFLHTPKRWEELRSLNAASPGVAAVGPDTLLPAGTALALPGDPLPWGKPDPVYLWTLAEKFLFTAWGREPTPEEVVPFWRGLTSGTQLEPGGAACPTGVSGRAHSHTAPRSRPRTSTPHPPPEVVQEPAAPPAPPPPASTRCNPRTCAHTHRTALARRLPGASATSARGGALDGADRLPTTPRGHPTPLRITRTAITRTGPSADRLPTTPRSHPTPLRITRTAITRTGPSADRLPTTPRSHPTPLRITRTAITRTGPSADRLPTTPRGHPTPYESPVPPSHEPPQPPYESPVPPSHEPPQPPYESPVPPSHEPPQPPYDLQPPSPVTPPAHESPVPPSHEPPPPLYESPVAPTHAPPPPATPATPGLPDFGPIEPEVPYVEAEAPRMPSFMPSLTGAETAAPTPEAEVVASSNRSLAGTAIGDAMMLWQLSRIRRRRDGRPDAVDPMEESLRQSARVDTLNLIEAAMRHLRAVTVGRLREKPAVLAVRVGTYGFEVLLNRPAQPPEAGRQPRGATCWNSPRESPPRTSTSPLRARRCAPPSSRWATPWRAPCC